MTVLICYDSNRLEGTKKCNRLTLSPLVTMLFVATVCEQFGPRSESTYQTMLHLEGISERFFKKLILKNKLADDKNMLHFPACQAFNLTENRLQLTKQIHSNY